jgi:hypothetical protein
MIKRIALIACLVVLPSRAFAWGQEGHRIVCGIAWQHLTPQAQALVTQLLGTSDEKSFVDACLWADQVRSARPETSAFHFVNIPANVAGFDMARDCSDPQRRCVTWAIAHFANIVGNVAAGDSARRDALRFVMHFVGDLHQPLHAGRPEDLGGNQIKVDFFGDAGSAQRRNNLHSVWDGQILHRANQNWPDAVTFLNSQITADDLQQWQNLDVIGWTNESYRVCEDYVYRTLPAGAVIRNAYYQPALGFVEVQLQKGGVRLANVLNQVAAGTATFGFAAN